MQTDTELIHGALQYLKLSGLQKAFSIMFTSTHTHTHTYKTLFPWRNIAHTPVTEELRALDLQQTFKSTDDTEKHFFKSTGA